MAAPPTLGSDLALARYTGAAAAGPLDVADSWGGLDLALGARPPVAGRRAGGEDLQVAAERANLGQALILRLLTPRGGLDRLGHAGYGSRLVELIGRPNDEATRALARLHVLECVAQERRAELVELSVDVAPGEPDTIRIALSVLPRGHEEPLALGLEMALA